MLTGSFVALVTPMQQDGAIDWEALEGLIDFHLANGTDGIVSVGTTGESATLPLHEHLEIIRFTKKHIAGKIPIIAGTGANSTQEALEQTELAQKEGVDACLLVTPYYNKPTQQGLIEHYTYIADRVQVPQILYNVPGRTACDLLPETSCILAQHPHIVGIKEASGDNARVTTILDGSPDDFSVLSGEDIGIADFMQLGGHGIISVTANITPAMLHELCASALQGNHAEAKKIQATLQDINNALFIESNPIPVKWVLWKMGLINKGIRLPLTWLHEDLQPEVERCLKELSLIE